MANMLNWNGDGKLDHWEETNKVFSFIIRRTQRSRRRPGIVTATAKATMPGAAGSSVPSGTGNRVSLQILLIPKTDTEKKTASRQSKLWRGF